VINRTYFIVHPEARTARGGRARTAGAHLMPSSAERTRRAIDADLGAEESAGHVTDVSQGGARGPSGPEGVQSICVEQMSRSEIANQMP
jgi:hypothetical protein